MLLSQIPPPNEICEYDDTAGLQAAQAEYEVRCLAWEVRWAATCFALVGSGVLTTLAELDLVTGPEPVEGSFKGPRAHEASHPHWRPPWAHVQRRPPLCSALKRR